MAEDTEAEAGDDDAPEKGKKKLLIKIVPVLLIALVAAKMFILKPKPLTAAQQAAKQKAAEVTLHDTCAAANGMNLINKPTTPPAAAPEEMVLTPNDGSVT